MNKLIKNHRYELKYNYYIYDDGRVYSEKTNKFLSTALDKDGYVKVSLISTDNKRHRYSVHRLVLENFHPVDGMENLQVNHIDGNKQNNNLSNLEWVTSSENNAHAYRIGLKNQKGSKNNASKLNEQDVKEIIDLLLSKKYTQKQIAQKYGVCDDAIGAIKRHQNWKELTKDIDFN